MPKSESTHAFVLRTVDYGEADRIVTLLTERFGKVSVLARGARRSRRRFQAGLSPYALLDVRVAPGRGELGHLSEATLVRPYEGIARDLDKLALAGAGLVLAREAIPMRESDARVFATVTELLDALDQADVAREELLVAFEVRLMSLLGFAPTLDRCAKTGSRAPEGQTAYFDPDVGGIVSAAAGGGPYRFSGSLRTALMGAVGASWASMTLAPWPAKDLTMGQQAMRAFVEHRLGRSLEVMESVRTMVPRSSS